MPVIVRPARKVSLSDHVRANPRQPLPADLLDLQIHNLIEAVKSTQAALEDIRRDDGKLRNRSVGVEQLNTDITRLILDGIEARAAAMTARAEGAAANAQAVEDRVSLTARDAEAAAVAAAKFLSAIAHADECVAKRTDQVVNLSDEVAIDAVEAGNWANYAKAQSDNAIAAKDEALQWAEYLAGPVVDSAKAPAYIEDSAFPHGLYYQPVQGYGGNAGLWSAKWWAIYAAQLVGPWGFYYLGGWYDPPVPGSINPDTGVTTPSPIAPGSFYYDIDTGQIYVWTGSEWRTPYALSPGYQNNYVYVATANQTVFSGADSTGKIPTVGVCPSDVHLNGVRLVATSDYTINSTTSTLTLLAPAKVNAIVQWDLLVPNDQLVPGAVSIFKTTITPAPDGVVTSFNMTYANPSTGTQPVNATSSAQMIVSLDGIVQEPGVDFNAAGAALNLTSPPPTGAKLWSVWIANALLAPPSTVPTTTFNGTPSAGVVLSNGNLTVTHGTVNNGTGVKSLTVKSTGKYYFEVKVQVTTSNTNGAGIAPSPGGAFTDPTVNAVNGFGAGFGPTNTFIYANNVSTAKNLGITSVFDVFSFAIDLTARLGWIRRNFGLWNNDPAADPATGTGGVTIPAGALAPYVRFTNGTATDALTANFGASLFANAVPSGFTAGWPL
jgi:hypothetical protein